MTKKITIGNHKEVYPIYKISLDLLYYNDQNDRIATWMSQYKAEHGSSPIVAECSEAYNQIIHEFITKSNPEALKNTQTNIKLIGQSEAGVVLTDGRIIDGNRRFTCLRNLAKASGEAQYFEAVILEHSITENAQQIKMMELSLQHGVDKPVDYDPVDRLVGIYNDIVASGLLTVQQYAKSVNQSEKTIEREVEKAKLMVEYLEFANMPNQFHVVRTQNLNDPLKELFTISSQCKDNDTREDLKNIVFANFLAHPSGDMTRYMRKIKKIANNPKTLNGFIQEQLGYAEQVCDIIESHEEMTETVISEQIRGNAQLQSSIAHSTEKWITKVDSDASRNAPAQQAEKAYEMLDSIDTNIFKKLTADQRGAVLEKLEMVAQVLEGIRSELNV